ncbi:hypothetical protein PLICRDRAFT_178746 [Plicaturopsis crispa FD-325 SS-3]|nr:hypothetical protein PLICRDRAFT_178746 [Plicaturopsis crispa FD-325 SS-3]
MPPRSLHPPHLVDVSLTAPAQKACGHDHCALSAAVPTCCACADRRPHTSSGGYRVYVDGVGYTPTGTRWAWYCSPCQAWCARASTLSTSGSSASSSTSPASSTASTPPSPSPADIARNLSHTQRQRLERTARAWGTASTTQAWGTATSRAWGTTSSRAWGAATSRAWGAASLAEIAADPDWVSPLADMFAVPLAPSHDAVPAPATLAPGAVPPLPSATVPPLHPVAAPSPVHTSKEDKDDADIEYTDDDTCKICFAAPRDALLLPCAHLVACRGCAGRLFCGRTPVLHSDSGTPLLRGNEGGEAGAGAEVRGTELIADGEGSHGQMGYDALRAAITTGAAGDDAGDSGRAAAGDIGRAAVGGPGREATCPVCRDGVRRWIRVYKA